MMRSNMWSAAGKLLSAMERTVAPNTRTTRVAIISAMNATV